MPRKRASKYKPSDEDGIKKVKTVKVHDPETLIEAEISEKAWELRKRGFSFHRIAKELGVPITEARRYITQMYAELRATTFEKAEELRVLQRAQIEDVISELWDDRRIPRVAEVILKAQERLAKLYGLDAPEKHVHLSFSLDNLSDEEIKAEAARLGIHTYSGSGNSFSPPFPLEGAGQAEIIEAEFQVKEAEAAPRSAQESQPDQAEIQEQVPPQTEGGEEEAGGLAAASTQTPRTSPLQIQDSPPQHHANPFTQRIPLPGEAPPPSAEKG